MSHKWIEPSPGGWDVFEVGGGWACRHGTYRWRWIARIAMWLA